MNLPNNVLHIIFLELEPKDLLSALQVCVKWNKVNKSKWFWNNKVLRDFNFVNKRKKLYNRLDYAYYVGNNTLQLFPEDDIGDYLKLFGCNIFLYETRNKIPYFLFQEQSLRYFTCDMISNNYALVDLTKCKNKVGKNSITFYYRCDGYNISTKIKLLHNTETRNLPFTMVIVSGCMISDTGTVCIPLIDNNHDIDIIPKLEKLIDINLDIDFDTQKYVNIFITTFICKISGINKNYRGYYNKIMFFIMNKFINISNKNWNKYLPKIKHYCKLYCLLEYYVSQYDFTAMDILNIPSEHKKQLKKLEYKTGLLKPDIEILLNYLYNNKLNIKNVFNK